MTDISSVIEKKELDFTVGSIVDDIDLVEQQFSSLNQQQHELFFGIIEDNFAKLQIQIQTLYHVYPNQHLISAFRFNPNLNKLKVCLDAPSIQYERAKDILLLFQQVLEAFQSEQRQCERQLFQWFKSMDKVIKQSKTDEALKQIDTTLELVEEWNKRIVNMINHQTSLKLFRKDNVWMHYDEQFLVDANEKYIKNPQLRPYMVQMKFQDALVKSLQVIQSRREVFDRNTCSETISDFDSFDVQKIKNIIAQLDRYNSDDKAFLAAVVDIMLCRLMGFIIDQARGSFKSIEDMRVQLQSHTDQVVSTQFKFKMFEIQCVQLIQDCDGMMQDLRQLSLPENKEQQEQTFITLQNSIKQSQILLKSSEIIEKNIKQIPSEMFLIIDTDLQKYHQISTHPQVVILTLQKVYQYYIPGLIKYNESVEQYRIITQTFEGYMDKENLLSGKVRKLILKFQKQLNELTYLLMGLEDFSRFCLSCIQLYVKSSVFLEKSNILLNHYSQIIQVMRKDHKPEEIKQLKPSLTKKKIFQD